MPWIVSVTLTLAIPLIAVYTYIARKFYSILVLQSGVTRARALRLILAPIFLLNLFPIVLLVSFLVAGRSASVLYSGEHFIFDLFLVYPFWFGVVISIEIALLMLIGDLLKLILLPIYRVHRARWRKLETRGIIIAAFLVTVYCIVVITLNTWTVRISTHDIPLPETARSLDGLRIALIADVQGDWRTTPSRIAAFVEKINQQEPDLALFAGDLISSGSHHIISTAKLLSAIKAPIGRIAAIGDHDIFSNKKFVREQLVDAGFTVIEDSSVVLKSRDAIITLTVLTHTYRQKTPAPRLEAIKQEAENTYRILLVHQPANSLLEFAANAEYNLFLAGHTHGGGIAIGIPGIMLLAPAHFESRFVSGMHDLERMHVVVTNGLGFTLAPIRFHAPAEITLLRLKASEPSVQ